MTILFKEAGPATRVSVRTRPGGVDATVLTGTFGGGGHARAAGATVDAPLAEARPRVLAEAERLVAAAGSLTMARSSLGPGLDGILVVAKPPGPTSHDIVALVRRLAATKRVGHGGTLDPFAAGVLPVFLGHATRIVEYHLGDRKAYRATVCFGASSSTDDLEGELTRSDGPPTTREAVEAALPGLTGTISQRPPAYSAIKVGGRRAYAMARAGESVELAAREVTIHALDIVSWDDSDPQRPIAVLDVDCSAGTYVRAIARDLGEMVGSAAYLGSLTRTASGPFTLDLAARSTTSGRRPPTGRTACCRCSCRSTRGSTPSPRSSSPPTRSPPSPAASSSAPRAACRAGPIATGCAIPRARSSRSRRRRAAGSPPTRCSRRRPRRRRRGPARLPAPQSAEPAMHVVEGVESLRPAARAALRRRRRLRRDAPRPRVPPRAAGGRGGARDGDADRDHLRPSSGRGPDGHRAAAPARPRASGWSGSRRPAWPSRSSSRSTRPCGRRPTTRSSSGSASAYRSAGS